VPALLSRTHSVCLRGYHGERWRKGRRPWWLRFSGGRFPSTCKCNVAFQLLKGNVARGPFNIQVASFLTTLPDLAGCRRLYPMYFSNRMPHVHCGACLHPYAPLGAQRPRLQPYRLRNATIPVLNIANAQTEHIIAKEVFC
jgi:hypothetical protein